MSEKKKTAQLFENNKIRAIWNEEEKEWYFSIIDIVRAVTGSPNPGDYWKKVIKRRLKQEKCQVVENCKQLKMQSEDGKFYKTEVANAEQLLRLIQSNPSPKAEPFKLWLAMVGAERMYELVALELTVNRVLATYLKKGYSSEWISQKLQEMQENKELPLKRTKNKKEGLEYAILSNEIAKACLSAEEYKKYKGIKKENLHSNMKTVERFWNSLSETTMSTLSKRLTYENVRPILGRDDVIDGGAAKETEEVSGEQDITPKSIAGFTKVLGAIIDSTDEDKKNKKDKKAKQ
jgi:hypothetical protein